MNRLARGLILAIGAAALLGSTAPARADVPGERLLGAADLKATRESRKVNARFGVGGFFNTLEDDDESFCFAGITVGLDIYNKNGFFIGGAYNYGLDDDTLFDQYDLKYQAGIAVFGYQRGLGDHTVGGLWVGYGKHRLELDFDSQSMHLTVHGFVVGGGFNHTLTKDGKVQLYLGFQYFPADCLSGVDGNGFDADDRWQFGGGLRYRVNSNWDFDAGASLTRINFKGSSFVTGTPSSSDADLDDIKVEFNIRYRFGKAFSRQ
jgi:opacity protein-like surface antigen